MQPLYPGITIIILTDNCSKLKISKSKTNLCTTSPRLSGMLNTCNKGMVSIYQNTYLQISDQKEKFRYVQVVKHTLRETPLVFDCKLKPYHYAENQHNKYEENSYLFLERLTLFTFRLVLGCLEG